MAVRRRIRLCSVKWLAAIDEHVRHCNIVGGIGRFVDIASDVLDGWALRSELDDLIRRRLLVVVHYGFDDSMGPDLLRYRDPDLCGTSWSVNPTEKMIRLFWPERLRLMKKREKHKRD
jgi:hypothetical protein